MRILLVHNRYQQPGGEDQVFAAETALLNSHGHQVVQYAVHNERVKVMNKLSLGASTLWNHRTYRELRAVIQLERPAVTHFHNTFPLISPAAYYASNGLGVPVVQTLHNYRLLCPNALLFRQERPCEDCLTKFFPWPGIVHACYRGSRTASATVAAMLSLHRAIGTWTHKVDVFIALTDFAKRKFIAGGLPADRIVVKPNFLYPDPGLGHGDGGYALFVGRLAPEKGIETLLRAWEVLGGKVALKIAGDGPLAERVAQVASRVPNVEWVGPRPRQEILTYMKMSSLLVFPSQVYEGLPMTVVEAYAAGLAVVASDQGSIRTLVDPNRTGLLFRPGDPQDLAAKVKWAWTHRAQLREMGREARREYERKYTAECNYEQLMDIYRLAMGCSSRL
jgi:glycosyltransferase involved in cell wall biosynthesis